MSIEATPEARSAGLRWLDVLLIGAVPVAAFGIGQLVGDRLADEVLPTIDAAAEYELRHGVPEAEESLAVIEAQQRLVRDRIASERTAVLVGRARLGTASPDEQSAICETIKDSEGLLEFLEEDAAVLVTSRGKTQVKLDQLKRTATESQSAALAKEGRRRDVLEIGATVAAGLVLLGAILVCTRGGRVLVDVKSVTMGSTLLLAVIIVTSSVGWVATAVMLVLGAILIARQPAS